MTSSIAKRVHVPKYVKLREQLRGKIIQMEPGQAIPTMTQLRNDYNLSQPTVDRAIQELRTEGLLVSRRGSGIYVSEMVKVKKVGIVFCDDIFDSVQPVFYRKLLDCFRRISSKSNKLLTYYINDMHYDYEQHGPSRLKLDVDIGQIDGLFVVSVPAASHAAYLKALFALDVPLEIFTQIDCEQHVYGDYLAVIKMGVEALIAQGCRRLALWHSGTIKNGVCQEVATFYEDVACSESITSAKWIVESDLSSKPFELSGYRQFKRMWASWDEKPDGIVCFDDHYTIGMLHAIDDMGIVMPDDLKIATLANKGDANPPAERVTRIESDPQKTATIMMKRLEQRMAGEIPKPNILKIKPRLML